MLLRHVPGAEVWVLRKVEDLSGGCRNRVADLVTGERYFSIARVSDLNAMFVAMT